MSNAASEFSNMMKLMAAQQAETRVFAYGHISNYDPTLQRVRVTFPSICDETGNPAISPWMPLSTSWAGAGFGWQVAPKGGEQVIVLLIDNRRGVQATAAMYYNQASLPPFESLNPGEAVLFHESGSYLYFHESGEVEVNAVGDIDMNATGTINAVAGENINITASGTTNVTASDEINITAPSINIGANSEALQTMMTAAAAAVYNSHTHSGVMAGGANTGAPNQQITSGQLTSVIKGG